MDFMRVCTRSTKKGYVEVYPKFIIPTYKDLDDLMIRGGDFYAVWDKDKNLWSTREGDAFRLIDTELDEYVKSHEAAFTDSIRVLHMWDSESGMVDTWHKYCQQQLRDCYKPLDESIIFANTECTKESYCSHKLSYSLLPGDISAYDELMTVLYEKEERHKIEWAIGAIVNGDSKHIQKFLVFYGSAGTGKSTVLNIIQKLFDGYYSMFDAKALGSSSDAFALEAFKTNPLVAIQHDGDLSRIEDNTRINSLVSHEYMTVNEKHRSLYSMRFNSFLLMGTNKPVRITDAKSGLLRRLIDVHPSGRTIPAERYFELIDRIEFELGAIASHCKSVYEANPNYFADYRPTSMMGESNDFFNYILDSFSAFEEENGVSLKRAWDMYKAYCDDAKVTYPFSMRYFKSELRNYFKNYDERIKIGDDWVRSWYSGFKRELIDGKHEPVTAPITKPDTPEWLHFEKHDTSPLDILLADCPAQIGNKDGRPQRKWPNVTTKLKDIDTSMVHYVQPQAIEEPGRALITIDFDIPDENGNKSIEKNLEAAAKWPPTYAELSKSGQGIHLEYIYTGDPSKLSTIVESHIEIKWFYGGGALRRRLTLSNTHDISTISSGLPMRGEKVLNKQIVLTEKGLRTTIIRAMRKEYHSGTKPSVEFIKKILDDAYDSGTPYDVTDMEDSVTEFAINSTHWSQLCFDLVAKMHFKSADDIEVEHPSNPEEAPIIFFDVEVFPNLFLVNWKAQGSSDISRMINPSREAIRKLMDMKLVGFNCRRYDNHILYAWSIGYSNEKLFELSQSIVADGKGLFREAYNISYTDIYDFAAKKQSLKKWEIELGIHHQELGLPWDKPVPEELWGKVSEYCDNDVVATEKLFEHLSGDWTARKILADLAGGIPNDTTNMLTGKIIFGNEKHPKLVYTDLSETFPGYEYVPFHQERYFNERNNEWVTKNVKPQNMYRGIDLGFGGYVYSKPGMYTNVALLDVRSLHPSSAIAMNYFGERTQAFKDLVDARGYIKHRDFDTVRKMFDGRLAKYLEDETVADQLAQALKIAVNAVYGLTSASFDNLFRDPRNVNNIIALRGALFMKTLQDIVTDKGYNVIHIKTDSIKIAGADDYIIQFCMDFAAKYGYEFEHEATYERICLVNDAVYIAKYDDKGIRNKGGKHANEWTATGDEFAIPYTFKTLFSGEPIEFSDLCETFSVSSALYLDYNENLPDVTFYEDLLDLRKTRDAIVHTKKEYDILNQYEYLSDDDILKEIEKGHMYSFVGKVGQFCPMKNGVGAAELLRQKTNKDGSIGYSYATGAKGWRWMESEKVKLAGMGNDINMDYFNKLANDSIAHISEFGDFYSFRDGVLNILS